MPAAEEDPSPDGVHSRGSGCLAHSEYPRELIDTPLQLSHPDMSLEAKKNAGLYMW